MFTNVPNVQYLVVANKTSGLRDADVEYWSRKMKATFALFAVLSSPKQATLQNWRENLQSLSENYEVGIGQNCDKEAKTRKQQKKEKKKTSQTTRYSSTRTKKYR